GGNFSGQTREFAAGQNSSRLAPPNNSAFSAQSQPGSYDIETLVNSALHKVLPSALTAAFSAFNSPGSEHKEDDRDGTERG
ncbi:hypothetical protein LINGRAHAP2_LOCUS20206, partial [Linum grandiflorum]